MSDTERAICARVKEFREQIKWPQPVFAKELGISRDQLANIEYGRSPLRFGLAIFLSKRFNLSQRWLALGVLPMQPMYNIPMEYSYLVKANSLFSWVFEGYLDGPTKQIESAMVRVIGEDNFRAGKFEDVNFDGVPAPENIPFGAKEQLAKNLVYSRFKFLPEVLQSKFADAIFHADSKFRLKYDRQIKQFIEHQGIQRFLDEAIKVEKPRLTNITESGKRIDVKAKLPELLQRLNRATADHGMKSTLAKYMGVPLSNVSQWLAGEREPGGETTLKLLDWVQHQERK